MNFDELFEYCQNLNNSNSEKCLVCHIPVENTDKHIKLKCTHIFHPDCVKYKNGSLKCLYCEKSSIPNKINWDTNILLEPNEISCKIILKTGLRKGQFCNRINCLYHILTPPVIKIINQTTIKSKSNNQTTIKSKQIKINKCTHIIKTGVKVGQMCNRDSPCKYHNNSNKVIEPIPSIVDNIIIDNNDNNLIEV